MSAKNFTGFKIFAGLAALGFIYYKAQQFAQLPRIFSGSSSDSSPKPSDNNADGVRVLTGRNLLALDDGMPEKPHNQINRMDSDLSSRLAVGKEPSDSGLDSALALSNQKASIHNDRPLSLTHSGDAKSVGHHNRNPLTKNQNVQQHQQRNDKRAAQQAPRGDIQINESATDIINSLSMARSQDGTKIALSRTGCKLNGNGKDTMCFQVYDQNMQRLINEVSDVYSQVNIEFNTKNRARLGSTLVDFHTNDLLSFSQMLHLDSFFGTDIYSVSQEKTINDCENSTPCLYSSTSAKIESASINSFGNTTVLSYDGTFANTIELDFFTPGQTVSKDASIGPINTSTVRTGGSASKTFAFTNSVAHVVWIGADGKLHVRRFNPLAKTAIDADELSPFDTPTQDINNVIDFYIADDPTTGDMHVVYSKPNPGNANLKDVLSFYVDNTGAVTNHHLLLSGLDTTASAVKMLYTATGPSEYMWLLTTHIQNASTKDIQGHYFKIDSSGVPTQQGYSFSIPAQDGLDHDISDFVATLDGRFIEAHTTRVDASDVKVCRRELIPSPLTFSNKQMRLRSDETLFLTENHVDVDLSAHSEAYRDDEIFYKVDSANTSGITLRDALDNSVITRFSREKLLRSPREIKVEATRSSTAATLALTVDNSKGFSSASTATTITYDAQAASNTFQFNIGSATRLPYDQVFSDPTKVQVTNIVMNVFEQTELSVSPNDINDFFTFNAKSDLFVGPKTIEIYYTDTQGDQRLVKLRATAVSLQPSLQPQSPSTTSTTITSTSNLVTQSPTSSSSSTTTVSVPVVSQTPTRTPSTTTPTSSVSQIQTTTTSSVNPQSNPTTNNPPHCEPHESLIVDRGQPFSFLPDCTDDDGDTMAHSSTLLDGSPLPNNLQLDPDTGRYDGNNLSERLNVTHTVSDGKVSTSQAFSFIPKNEPPPEGLSDDAIVGITFGIIGVMGMVAGGVWIALTENENVTRVKQSVRGLFGGNPNQNTAQAPQATSQNTNTTPQATPRNTTQASPQSAPQNTNPATQPTTQKTAINTVNTPQLAPNISQGIHSTSSFNKAAPSTLNLNQRAQSSLAQQPNQPHGNFPGLNLGQPSANNGRLNSNRKFAI